MARHNVDADQAFEMLRKLSQSVNTKLRGVATHVIETDASTPSVN